MTGTTTRLAVILHMVKDQPWGARVMRDIQTVLANEPSVAAEFADPGGNPVEQVRLLNECLQRGVDALIVNPIDPKSVRPVLRKFRDAKIPVIIINTDIDDAELYSAMILGNHRQFGREVGEFFVKVMGGIGNLVEILGPSTSSITADRSLGFRDALAAYPKLRVVDTCIGNWTYDRALREFNEVLTRQPHIDGVFAHNDEMASAALDAAAQAGREAEMLVSGIDALPASIRMVSQGRLAATFLYPSPGKDAVYALQAILHGEDCVKKVLLQTWPYKSNSRIQAWQRARKLT